MTSRRALCVSFSRIGVEAFESQAAVDERAEIAAGRLLANVAAAEGREVAGVHGGRAQRTIA